MMKPVPTRPSDLEPRPPLERLRKRVQGAMRRLGTWGKRLLAYNQEEVAVDAQPPGAGVEDWPPGRAPEPPSMSKITRPVRSVTPSRLSQPARRSRPYFTEALSAAPQPAEGGYADMAKTPEEGQDTRAAESSEVAGASAVDFAQQQSIEPGLAAEATPEQIEETRRTLTRKLLKGSRTGLLLTLEPGYVWSQVLEVLAARLAESPTFFQGALLSVDTRRRALEPQEVAELQALLAPYEMAFKEVGSDELHDPRALPSGATRAAPAGDTTPTLAIRANDAANTLLTRRTIRSGQRLRYESSVVIMGDVNAGAEVIAGGDVLVWGTLRGTVHAGYPGNEEAVVCALALAPVQLRIGKLASRPPDDGALPPQLPEVASVKNGQIVVESWNAGRASRR